MRGLVVLCGVALFGGCSTVDGVSLDTGTTLNPTKVYLSPLDLVRTTQREVDQFACLSGAPLACSGHAHSLECRCM